jgi:hypothetical protein
MLLGAVAGGIPLFVIAIFRWDICDKYWYAVPAAMFGGAALVTLLAIRFATIRLPLASCAVVLTGFAAWMLFLAAAIGCE